MKRRLLTAVAGLFALAVASRSDAYVPTGPKWKKLPVTYKVNQATIPASIASTAVASVDAGFSSWSAPMCTNFKAQNLGNTTSSYNSNDNQNTILWKSDTWPGQLGSVSSTIGITLSVYSGDTMIDADIVFNDVGFNWNNTGTGNNVDTQSIATHEEGHFLGLDHTPTLSAVMYASYSGGLKRNLQSDDQAGVCAIYPCTGTGCGASGAGGSSGTGGSTGTGGSGTAGSGSGTSPCNPVTNQGCTAGNACDFNDQGGYECFPPPNTKKICEQCGQSQGYCEGGLTCAGICVKFCCDDGDCGTGQCDKALLGNGGVVGVCVKQAGQGQNAQPACDAPAKSPSNGACLGGTGTGGSGSGTGGSGTGTSGSGTGTSGSGTAGSGTSGSGTGEGPMGAGGGAGAGDPGSTGGASAASSDESEAESKSACGCEVPGGGRPDWWMLASLGLAGILASRRRR